MERSTARALLDLAFDAGSVEDVAELRALAAARMRALLGGDLASWTEVDLADGTAVAPLDPPEVPGQEEITAAFGRLAHEHPLVIRSITRAQTISDYLSLRRFHSLALYCDVYRPLGAEDQLAATLRVRRGRTVGMALNRSRRSFGEWERGALDLLVPVLQRSYARAWARERGRNRARQVAGTGVGVLALGPAGRVVYSNEAARCLIDDHLGQAAAVSLHATAAGLMAARGRHRGPLEVVIERGEPGEPTLLELRERRNPAADGRLTPREREVVLLVAAGRTNQQVARTLDISSRTVENHLQAAYRRLGVTNRTAAAAVLTRPGAGADAGP